ncbi:hypothetical protein TCDM_07503 [Trypanosoma cruzi Dm28c]|uniref:Uncharacterized protein n=1 Tax=Trypanosoma cruzi Dm28c TaxID=1416333 RepID=V5B9V1_TRYCR|nr:hypothetical protein TCDM_07503 [Trypanosoma cruzi Dm28c]
MSITSHTDNVLGYACVCLVCEHSTRTGVCICVSENLTNTQAMPYYHLVTPNRQPTQEELCATEVPPISNKKSNGVDTAHAYGERDPFTWIVFYWASSAGCRPSRRKRSPLAAQRRPHRKSIECCHGGSRDKQQQQCHHRESDACPTCRPSRCFDPCRREKILADCRGILAGSTSPLSINSFREWPCPHPSVVCRDRSQCSLDRGRMPVAKLVQHMPVKPSCSTRPLTSPPHGTTGSSLPLVADIVHTCAWSRKIAFPSS